MPYSAAISRTNPGCFLFLVDQSGSMIEALGGVPGQRKMDMAADALNRCLDEISQRCSQGIDIRDYFEIGVITYTTDSQGTPCINSLFPGTSAERPFLSISRVVDIAQLEERQVRENDGAGGIVEVTRRIPLWLHPAAEYATPMCTTLDLAAAALERWIDQHPDSYPPIVINITDGMANDGDPEPAATAMKNLATADGNALLLNCHLSAVPTAPVLYPDQIVRLPDDFAQKMFQISSILPESNRRRAESLGIPVTESSRGIVFNSDMASLVQFLDIGTRATPLH